MITARRAVLISTFLVGGSILTVVYCIFDYYQSKLYPPDQFILKVTNQQGDINTLMSNGLFYRGSDKDFHYFIQWRIPLASEYLKVKRVLLPIPTEFQLTMDRTKWLRCSSWFENPNKENNAHP